MPHMQLVGLSFHAVPRRGRDRLQQPAATGCVSSYLPQPDTCDYSCVANRHDMLQIYPKNIQMQSRCPSMYWERRLAMISALSAVLSQQAPTHWLQLTFPSLQVWHAICTQQQAQIIVIFVQQGVPKSG